MVSCVHAAVAVLVLLTELAAAAPVKVAIVGGGIGGTAAAFFLQQLQPTWHVELFERERLGGRAEELFLDGRTLELGASIIHAQNHYVLSLAKEMGLTLIQGDDTGDAFSLYDGSSFVFSQSGSQVRDTLAVLHRYGISPLRYKWLAEEMGRRFSRLYDLHGAGQAFATPQQLWEAVGLFNLTQQSAADYMQAHLAHGVLRYGAAAFIEELAGAVNRINYNQRNAGLNALAGLVSYLPAAQPEVYSIQEGNAALPRKLAAAAKLQALHLGTAVQAGSAIELQGVLPPGAVLPKREYQSTVTTYVTGALNPSYFKVPSLPAGDIFVTSSADTLFSVIASKGSVSGSTARPSSSSHAFEDGQPVAVHQQQQQQQLWKVFSQQPLSEDLLQQLFFNSTVIISKPWKAYPRFKPPEVFAPFSLSPGLCYNNALENGASAMEVSAVAAMNCALLLQQQLSPSSTSQVNSGSSSSSSGSSGSSSAKRHPAGNGAGSSSVGVSVS
ncbi:hypothetical protein OEZ86_004041 [Tetradesmus obliquus]|nr:hypothetical protein OEZ86_004041 [Tetradesmus obliquus]